MAPSQELKHGFSNVRAGRHGLPEFPPSRTELLSTLPKHNELYLTGRVPINAYCHHIEGACGPENQERAEVCPTL